MAGNYGQHTQADNIAANGSTGLVTLTPGHVSTDNSTSSTLTGDAVYTGTFEDVTNFGVIVITVKSDVASATDGFAIEFSCDGVSTIDTDVYTIPANIGKTFSFQAAAQYYRVTYTNGASPQTSFDLQTVLKPYYVKPSSHRISDSIVTDDDAELVKAVITGKDPGGDFINFTSTTAGNFKVSLEELENAISVNSNTQLRTTSYLADGTEGNIIIDGTTGTSAGVDQFNRIKTGVYDRNGNSADVDALGTLKVSEVSILLGASFEGLILDPNTWDTTTANGGSVAQNGEVILSTNTTANGSAQLDSVLKTRKIPGVTNQFRGVGHFDTVADTDNVRAFGVYDDDNGAFFKLDGTTMKVVTRSGGVDTEVDSGNFNGDISSITPDINIHRWAIDYTAYDVRFRYDDQLVHTVPSGQDPWSLSLAFPIRVENNNVNGNTTNNGIDFQLLCVLRNGQLSTEKKSYYQSGTTAGVVLKYGAGEVHSLIIGAVANNSNITLYDNVAGSGDVIWSSGAMGAQTQPFSLDMGDLQFSIGLTLVIATATSNITVVYE